MELRPPSTRADAWRFYGKLEELTRAAGTQTWREAERWLGRNDLFYLMTRLLRREDIDKGWLFDRCREVESARDGYLDLWAREHGKSSLITFGLTVQDILRDPEITVGIFSHTRPIAKGFLAQIKTEFEQNDYLKALYSDVLWAEPKKEATRWSEDGGIVVRRAGNPKEATIEAWGLVDGQPTGKHFRLRVYDDVVTRESVTTPEQVDKTTKAWELSQNLGIQAEMGGTARYIGTRYSLHDTYATMLERQSAKPRIYPATHNGRFDGRPVLFSAKEWADRLRDGSRTTVAAQLLQNPMADEAATFRTEWLRSYEVRPRTLNVYIMADPSRGRRATSDNTAIAVIGIAAGGAKFFLDGYCHRMTLSQRWLKLRDLYRKWSRAQGVQHIAVGYERFGAQSDDEYFAEQMDREKLHFAIAELNWPHEGGNSKKERVERLEPDFRNARFYLPLAVWRDGSPCVWNVDRDPDSKTFRDVQFKKIGGLTAVQMQAVAAGSEDLIAKAVKATDADGRVYDVTLRLMEEFENFPFGAHDDLIDACSRVYDMNARGPVLVSKEKTEPTIFWDS